MDGVDSAEVGGPNATPEEIAALAEDVARLAPQADRARPSLPPKAGSQAQAQLPARDDGKADLKWPGGRAGSQLVSRPDAVLGLYVHIPFCSAICNYCNFNRGLFDAELKARYVDALLTEIRRAADGAPADTIFFGGGTPSLLEPDEVGAPRRRLPQLASSLAADAEVTLEANPETVTRERLRGLSRGGNQSPQLWCPILQRRGAAAPEPAALGRACRRGVRDGASGRVRQRLARPDDVAAGAVGLEHGSSRSTRLVALGPDHASLYLLEIYPERAAARRHGEVAVVGGAGRRRGGDVSAGRWTVWMTPGTSSTRSRTSRGRALESRHNLKYWIDGEWLGFGCGAHSTRGGARWKNVASTEDYIGAIVGGQVSRPSGVSCRDRSVSRRPSFTRLRLTEGWTSMRYARAMALTSGSVTGRSSTRSSKRGS